MSRDVGVLFQAEMVRALLAGNKTQTRRLAKPRASAGDRIYVRETFAEEGTAVYYRADDRPQEGWGTPPGLKWTPAIHMPTRLARIWLQVTNVRTEPLLNVTDADAFAEGVVPRGSGALARAYQFQIAGKTFESGTPRACFLAAWDGFNVKCPSSTNPTVTVYTFERLP